MNEAAYIQALEQRIAEHNDRCVEACMKRDSPRLGYRCWDAVIETDDGETCSNCPMRQMIDDSPPQPETENEP